MLITGFIYDNATSEGIPYASVTVTDNQYNQLTGGTAADRNGYFQLDSPYLDNGWLYVSSTGYHPVMVDPGVYQQSANIGLDVAGNLEPVYVTANRSNNDWLLYLVAGGLIMALLAEGKKQRRIKGVTQLQVQEWLKIALTIGIPIAVFFLVVKPLLVSLGLLPDRNERVQSQSDKEATQAQGQLATWSSANHTYSQATIDSIAVGLRNATADWYGYDYTVLVKQLVTMVAMTNADAKYLLGTFVKKNGMTLYQWWYDKFEDAFIAVPFLWEVIYWQPGWFSGGEPHDYRAHFQKLGITESNADKLNWTTVVEKFVSYVYTVAGIAKQ